jgi:hypothetical protein
MPKEVADALKKNGQWKPGEGSPSPAAMWNAGTVKGAGG